VRVLLQFMALFYVKPSIVDMKGNVHIARISQAYKYGQTIYLPDVLIFVTLNNFSLSLIHSQSHNEHK
jgi:hypothetical protein